MAERHPKRDSYYYARGERVALTLDTEHCAVDLRKVANEDRILDLEALCKTHAAMKYRNVLVFKSDDLEELLRQELCDFGAIQPVYKHGTTLLLFLPEVRLEETQEGVFDDIKAWLEGLDSTEIRLNHKGNAARILPNSENGTDALQLANQLQEKFAPTMVQARMVRLRMRVSG